MIRRASLLALTAVTISAGSVTAQEPARQPEEGAGGGVLSAILAAIELPAIVDEARREGVSDSTLVGVLGDLRRSRLPAGAAEDILEQELEVVRAGGPVDNFGAFVQRQLASGLRGRELAQAIRAEHRRMGIGIPERRDRANRPGLGRGMRGGQERGGPPGARGQGARGPGGDR